MEEINAVCRQCWAEQDVRVPEGLFVRSCSYYFKFIFNNEFGNQKVYVWLDENTFHIFDWEDFYSYFSFDQGNIFWRAISNLRKIKK